MNKSLWIPIIMLSVGAIGLAVVGRGLMGPGSPWMGLGRGPWDIAPPGDRPPPLSIAQAAGEAREYLGTLEYRDLGLAEVMEFSNHFYVAVREEGREKYAFELLVNRYTGEIFPEPGPNLMWNTKYGHMGGGMMGRHGRNWRQGYAWANPAGEMSVSPQQARERGQEFLDARLAGRRVGEDLDEFYGYYTLHVLEDGQVAGMLSVNGYSGDVWYHQWHGRFVRMSESGDRSG